MRRRFIEWLLLLYPTAWRAEYGAELGALLSLRPLTIPVLADVLRSAALERWRSDPVWAPCSLFLVVWTVLGIAINNTVPFSPRQYELYQDLWTAALVLAACRMAWLGRAGSPAGAAAKTALVGFFPEVVALYLWAAGLFHPVVTAAAGPFPLWESRLALFEMTFPTTPQPGFAVIPFAFAVLGLRAALAGFVGGLLGRALRRCRPTLIAARRP